MHLLMQYVDHNANKSLNRLTDDRGSYDALSLPYASTAFQTGPVPGDGSAVGTFGRRKSR